MISACCARLMSSMTGLRLHLIVNSQITTDNCQSWGESLSSDEALLSSIKKSNSILELMIQDKQLVLTKLHHNAIITSIVDFTSTFEFFLNDIVTLCMKRNYSLLKKGLKEVQINPIDIVDYEDLKELRYKYISIISQSKCSGELWSKKLKRVSTFLSLSNKYYTHEVNKTIDSIWMMRNIIAHGNSRLISFRSKDITYSHSMTSKDDDYNSLIIELLNNIETLVELMRELDNEALAKWPA